MPVEEHPFRGGVIKAGMVLRGGGVNEDMVEVKAPPPLYPEGFIPPDEAHRQAQAILAEAAASAQRLQEEARQHGHEQGFQQGYMTGQQAAIDAWSALLNAFKQQIEGLLAQRENMMAAAEPDIVRLTLMTASKVIQRESQHADLALAVIAATVRRATEGTIVRIRVNPTDYARLQAAPVADMGRARYDLLADGSVGMGGCVIECQLCTIDASFRLMFEEVARELMRDEPTEDPLVRGEIEALSKAPRQPAMPHPFLGQLAQQPKPPEWGKLDTSVESGDLPLIETDE